MTDQATRLPRRPRLRPGLEVFDRRPGEVQIGLDPRHAMVASGLPPDLVRILHRLDGRHRTDELFALADSEHGDDLRQLLTSLTKLGLVEEAWNPAGQQRTAGEVGLWSLRGRQPGHDAFTRRAHSAVVLRGNGRLTIAMATLLAASGVGHVGVEADGVVTEQDTGSGYLESDIGRQRRAAAVDAVRRANPAGRHARLRRDRQPELVVLADSIVPAPEVIQLLVHEGVPHLPVRVREGLGIVGPLVYPGRSTCMSCADLHRKSMDSRWPMVAGQLAGRSQSADLCSVQATAGVAVSQILRVLGQEDGPPPVWNATIEIDTYEGTVQHRPWPPNPDCACGARPSG
ncbi:bacteriocin biosynthesis cyclodehydratase domain-containing protein [Amycolatopsis bartoniae]|uniref:TOMM precursor leader peptide-binding protein n=1 Tax=Amycolatopsis bartoniae TaxID=941986 RepID=UPI00119227D9|nr:TOMM precursor leader peptide-binding protein [Amycolatopsis bartoniae]MBB2938779.1 bacteriocin biosynthesis cyclodehydratase domain-containing protein [Amycolatopsis bartoniae]TVS98852.1 TOMM precursor leader peptide-binding protein [Amycolatopsis bartoniae]